VREGARQTPYVYPKSIRAITSCGIKGDEITLTTKVEGGGDFGGGPMTLKRQK
jgi:hypothetical protein